ncbi:MAG TPA: SAM-dependent methyltransferase, partial [Thermoanaerobaculia bacterium]|nr:SAM-dependent methyltransferase [Thermoanaerobaculia bacterium]
DDLLALPSIEYLTRERLADAARPLGLSFSRRRVLYPFWYESRPLVAFVKRRRAPSRFDLWEALVP